MPRSYWVSVVAAVGLSLSFPVYGNPPQDRLPHSADYFRDTNPDAVNGKQNVAPQFVSTAATSREARASVPANVSGYIGDGGTKWTDVAIVGLTIGLVIASFLQFGASILQWLSMKGQERQLRLSIIYSRNASRSQSRDMRASIDVAQASARASQLAADAAIAAQRPWLEIEVLAKAPVEIDDQGARFVADVIITNRGNSPALNVMGTAVLVPSVFGSDCIQLAVQKSRTDHEDMRKRIPFSGETVFPDSVSRANDGWRFGISRQPLDTELAKMGGATSLGVVIGVSYAFVGGTGFTILPYEIFIPDPSDPRLPEWIDGTPRKILPNQMQLRPVPIWGITE